jgi:hypothetical protein
MFVVGADSDRARAARATAAFADTHGNDSLMLNVLTPGLGTRQYAMMDAGNRIFEERWQFYDGQHVVFTPQQMTPLELQTGVVTAYQQFYSLRRGLKLLARLRFGTMLENLWGWLYIRRWQQDPTNRAYVEGLGTRSGASRD